ncbi:MAG TPA: NfeD family protein [Lachnospiraceae bacterium]|nr:NfeD family protein [Lachnospiraceae bacterium]HPF28497.1 NfeD family protein [Lachnospiraceae bacterium]
METIIWLVIFVVMIGVELVTMGLATIWFAGGALFALVAASLGLPVYVQIILFIVISLVLLYFTRPLAVKYFNKGRVKTNVEGIVGETAVVTEDIENLKGLGKVVLNGMEWTARAEQDAIVIPKGTNVTVVLVKGVKLIVK